MEALFSTARVADLVLAVLVLEGLVLFVVRRRTGRGPDPWVVLPFLVAGGFLTLALRAALTDASWPWMAVALLGALLAHGVDLALRWAEGIDGSGGQGGGPGAGGAGGPRSAREGGRD